jgi:hypothetical protein
MTCNLIVSPLPQNTDDTARTRTRGPAALAREIAREKLDDATELVDRHEDVLRHRFEHVLVDDPQFRQSVRARLRRDPRVYERGAHVLRNLSIPDDAVVWRGAQGLAATQPEWQDPDARIAPGTCPHVARELRPRRE